MASSNVRSISSVTNTVRRDVFPLDQWTITTCKGIILQSQCTCDKATAQDNENVTKDQELCRICEYYKLLPQIYSMPDMVFADNLLRLEHNSGIAIEFNALDALKAIKETKDPLQVASAKGWQSAQADCPYASRISKPFDWTFTTDYRGTIVPGKRRQRVEPAEAGTDCESKLSDESQQMWNFNIQDTEERINVNKLKVREQILFYDDVPFYEDELADHGTAEYSVKVRVMPNSLFILARYYLRLDGVMARINDTRIYHELDKRFLIREYTNREAKLSSIQKNIPISTLINPNELQMHLPVVESKYERLELPRFR